MRYLRAVSMAFSMYSRLPMPWVRWSDDCRAWVLCAFPLVGAVLGLLLLAWSALADLLTLTPQLRAAGAVLLPLAYTGGIHMDGFCDTCDALASPPGPGPEAGDPEGLPRGGAFAVLGCVSYLLLQYALWCQPGWEKEDLWVLALVPVLSRAMSGYRALHSRGARADGLLAAFTEQEQGRGRQRFLLFLCALLALAIGMLGVGCAAVAAAILVYLWYIQMARREFGGLTGDLAGVVPSGVRIGLSGGDGVGERDSGGVDMILIVGGLGAGKRDFARRELGVREEELSPVLGPGTQVLYDLQALDPLPDLEELMGLRAVICNEVGCGLVPHPGGGTAAAGGGGPPLLPAGGEGRGGVPDLLRAGYKTKIEQTERNRHGIADDPPQLHQRESAAAVCRLPGPPPGPGGRGAGGAPPGEMPPIDGLWVSPMLRCRQTAEILFPGVEQRLVDALKECDFGTFEGKTWAELKDNPIYQAWLAGGPPIAFPGGEVLGGAHRPLPPGVAHVVEQARALGMSRPGILAHGGTLMSAMSGFAVPHQDFTAGCPATAADT